MGKLIAFLIVSLVSTVAVTNSFALDCSAYSRTVVTDQKNISYDLALGYLQLHPSFIIEMGTSGYSSWRGQRKDCLVDIFHYMQFRIVQKSPIAGERCVTTINTYVKDHFSTTAEREIKPRDVERICSQETDEERAVSNRCASIPECPVSRDGVYIQDFSNDCKCVLLDQKIQYDDVYEDYLDFYNFDIEYKKPSNIDNLFD